MSDFMQKAGHAASVAVSKAKEFAVYAADRTKRLTRIARLNVDISGQKDIIKRAYTEIGTLYYEAHRDAPEDALSPMCRSIDDALNAIAAMEAEITELKAKNAETPEDADFETVVEAQEADAAEDGSGDIEVEIEVLESDAEPEIPFSAASPVEASEPEPEPVPEPEPEPEPVPEPVPEPEPEENNNQE